MVEVSGIGVVIPGIIANTIQKQGVDYVIINDVDLHVSRMSSYSYIALLINREQGAQSNEKEKRLSASEWLRSNRNVTNVSILAIHLSF